MAISREDVKYIALLARLGLTEEEVSHFQTQLEGILSYIDQLKKVDVSGIPPTAHAIELKNVFRQDIVKPSLEPSKVIGAAPSKQGQFFKVPKVIE